MIMDILLLNERGLSANLCTNLIMRKTICREEGDLLSSSDGVHDINSGDTGLDHFLGVVSLIRVNRLSLDIKEVFGEYWGSMVDGHTGTIELATEHLDRDRHAEDITGELTMGVEVINIGCTFKDLYDGLLALNLEDLTFSHLSVSESDVDDFSIFRELDIIKCNKRSFDIENCAVVDSRSDHVIGGSGSDVSVLSRLKHRGVYLCNGHGIFFVSEVVFTVYVLLFLFLKFDLLR